MNIESFGISDIGLQRQNNEDAWGILPQLHFYIVADGMGGHQAGEIASHETVESLLKTIKNVLTTKGPLSQEEILLELKEAILETNSWVNHLSQENEEMHGMGTTLCCLLIHQNKVVYAHVGDSRIYRFRKKLTLLTQDHSLRKELAERYQLDEKKASGLPSKHVITRAIGTSYHVEPDLNCEQAHPGDIYLLCTDGLTDVVSEEEISALLEQNLPTQKTCEKLMQIALTQGAPDNITFIMIRV